jgi:hypothetical protein
VRVLALLLVVLGADSGRSSVDRPSITWEKSEAWNHQETHRGTFPDGGRLTVWMRPGDRLVPQPPTAEWAFTIETLDGGSQYFTVPEGTRLHQIDGGAVELEHPEGHAHCWHRSPLQHTVANHRDEYCCHCAVDRCVNLSWPGLCGEGHGRRCMEPQLDLKRPRMP